MNMFFEGFDFTNFWDDCDYAKKEYIEAPPSDELIASVEQELGYKLPGSYIWLMKHHNGGLPVNTCFPTEVPTSWAEDHVAITGIMGIGRTKRYSLCGEFGSRFMIDEWEYPAIGVAICDCPSAGHDMIFLDYRECGPEGEPKVVHIDQEYDYEITPLANSFEEFIRGLVNEEVYEPDPEEEKAEALKKVQTAPFSSLLQDLCRKIGAPEAAERRIREIAVRIVEDKGYFALHEDENSYQLYDLQFLLYENAHPGVTEQDYLQAYPGMITFGGGFSTGGYAPGFVEDWLKTRKKAGIIQKKNGALTLSADARAKLMEQLTDGGKNKMKNSFIYWTAASATVMLMLPWLAITFVKGDAGMAVCFLLFYAVNPIYSAIIGFFAGKDIKHLWSLPIISAVLFLAGTWIFFSMGETAFLIYATIYLVLGIIAMLFSMLIGRKTRQ